MDYGLGLCVVIGVALILYAAERTAALYRHITRKPVIRPEVGGVWQMNHDWNVRSRK